MSKARAYFDESGEGQQKFDEMSKNLRKFFDDNVPHKVVQGEIKSPGEEFFTDFMSKARAYFNENDKDKDLEVRT